MLYTNVLQGTADRRTAMGQPCLILCKQLSWIYKIRGCMIITHYSQYYSLVSLISSTVGKHPPVITIFSSLVCLPFPVMFGLWHGFSHILSWCSLKKLLFFPWFSPEVLPQNSVINLHDLHHLRRFFPDFSMRSRFSTIFPNGEPGFRPTGDPRYPPADPRFTVSRPSPSLVPTPEDRRAMARSAMMWSMNDEKKNWGSIL